MVRKIYCYVDESGQDTKRKVFLVGSVVLDQEDLKGIREKLEEVELRVKKGRRKWQGLSLKKKRGCLDLATHHRLASRGLWWLSLALSGTRTE